MARTDFVITAFESLAVVPEAELDALREAVEVLEDRHDNDLAVNAHLERRNDNQYGIITELHAEGDEFEAAALEAVEVLEDMYAQRDAETERWFQAYIKADHEKYEYASRLKATDAAYGKVAAEADYWNGKYRKLVERIKTYKETLAAIVDGYNPFNYKPRAGDGLRRLAYHVLNSRIEDGGSDF